MRILRKEKILKTMVNLGQFYLFLVFEFIVNLLNSINKPGRVDYHKVHVRGVCFEFSPEAINSYIKRSTTTYEWKSPPIKDIVLELRGGTHKAWPRKEQLNASVLSVKYAIFHKSGLAN